jgi:chromosome partitioning protein
MSRRDGSTRIIALINQKGGVGKTTTTVNLGAAIAQAGHRVLLIDLDPQAHLTLHVGIDPASLEASVYDLLIEPDTSAFEIVRQVTDRLAVLPAEVDLAGAEQELSSLPDRHTRLRNKLQPITDAFDYVLLDCPPSLGMLTINGLAAAREVIVPMQAHFLALQGLSKLLETVQLVRQKLNTSLRVSGVVLAMHESHTNLAAEVVNDLQQFFDAARKFAMPWSHARIYQPPVRRNIKLAECPSFGQSIFQYAPTCPGAADYLKLAEDVMGAAAAEAPSQNAPPAEEPASHDQAQSADRPPSPEVSIPSLPLPVATSEPRVPSKTMD